MMVSRYRFLNGHATTCVCSVIAMGLTILINSQRDVLATHVPDALCLVSLLTHGMSGLLWLTAVCAW